MFGYGVFYKVIKVKLSCLFGLQSDMIGPFRKTQKNAEQKPCESSGRYLCWLVFCNIGEKS